MDGTWFDTLARTISASRRGGIRSIFGAAVGILFASRFTEVSAGCKKVGKRCDKSKDCCDGAKCKGGKKGKCRCKSGLSSCPGEKECKDLNEDANHCGACDNACAAGEVCCTGACVDLANDHDNCGDCGAACGSVQACSAGVCLICQPTTPLCGNVCCGIENCCGGVCVDLETSRVNCGSCFNLCDFDETCINGVCKVPIA